MRLLPFVLLVVAFLASAPWMIAGFFHGERDVVRSGEFMVWLLIYAAALTSLTMLAARPRADPPHAPTRIHLLGRWYRRVGVSGHVWDRNADPHGTIAYHYAPEVEPQPLPHEKV